jgi:hypothetical protein
VCLTGGQRETVSTSCFWTKSPPLATSKISLNVFGNGACCNFLHILYTWVLGNSSCFLTVRLFIKVLMQ